VELFIDILNEPVYTLPILPKINCNLDDFMVVTLKTNTIVLKVENTEFTRRRARIFKEKVK